MRRYKPYPAYKDSGVEWLGQVPEHWEVVPLKRLFQCQDGKRVPLNSEQRADIKGDIPYWGSGGVVDYIDQHIFDETLILLGEDGAPFFERDKPVAYVIEGKAWINNHIHVLKPFDEKASMWLVYYLNSVEYRNYIDGSTRDKLTQDDMKTISILLPTLPEILSIVCYLDRETARIDSLVAAKTRFIELLQEKRQALITHAVTKGIDPKAKMKDSGVEWLGQVPEYWIVTRLRFLCENIKAGPFGSALTKDMYEISGYRVYGQEQVIPDDFSKGNYYISNEKFEELRQYEVKPEDVLISCVGTFGKIAVVPINVESGIINPRLIRIRTNNIVLPMYFAMVMKSNMVFEQFSMWSRGGTMDIINIGILSEIVLPIPPLNEQKKLLIYINHRIARIDALIDKTQRSIELLKERRSALITAAVAGKIDLREAAV